MGSIPVRVTKPEKAPRRVVLFLFSGLVARTLIEPTQNALRFEYGFAFATRRSASLFARRRVSKYSAPLKFPYRHPIWTPVFFIVRLRRNRPTLKICDFQNRVLPLGVLSVLITLIVMSAHTISSPGKIPTLSVCETLLRRSRCGSVTFGRKQR